MSEEMREELQENEVVETMADYEDHIDDANPWNRVTEYMEKKTVLPVKVEGVVNGGVIAMVEGLRGFVPASKLSLTYIEDLETYLLKDIEVQVIDVDQANNRLVLSAREILKEKRAQSTRRADREPESRNRLKRNRGDTPELWRIRQTGERSVRSRARIPDLTEARKSTVRRTQRRR